MESLSCDNGIKSSWDYKSWKITTEESLKNSTCTISFLSPKNFAEYIEYKRYIDDALMYDETIDNNLRYIGANPDNYVKFNNELWRIIGVMNNIKNSERNLNSYVKIIRNENIGAYSYDNKSSGTGSSTSSYGSNDWTDSALMKILNSGAYYNRINGNCPSGSNGTTKSCNFSNTGLTSEAKSMITQIIWDLGGNQNGFENIASNWYRFKKESNGNGRPITWTGYVGLMDPSNYGYTTSGGTLGRETCLNIGLNSWSGYKECYMNDWIYTDVNQSK